MKELVEFIVKNLVSNPDAVETAAAETVAAETTAAEVAPVEAAQ